MRQEADERQRLDRWLWFARLVRSRTRASALVSAGQVRVNRLRVEAPAHTIKPGDVLTIAVGHRVKIWRVLGVAARRGNPSEARQLYADLSEEVTAPFDDPSRHRDVGSALG
ncbi:MAG: RNA-binding S4 domain-containing protein [Hyphomicrobiales bacterium]|nr:RNA-binding S4 domain-containing protein [Hyphomicrobiales bacterium]OQW85337.1 MAG: hypothetical protein BVN31_00520 [Proteobacteria bacterium ST_bin15]